MNGSFLEAAERISAPAGLTAARWKVLGAVLYEPRTVAEIGRVMGLARQSVQRLSDVLVTDGLAEYLENPAHRSAKLLGPTARGFAAIAKLAPRQAAWANATAHGIGKEDLEFLRTNLKRLIENVEIDQQRQANASSSD